MSPPTGSPLYEDTSWKYWAVPAPPAAVSSILETSNWKSSSDPKSGSCWSVGFLMTWHRKATWTSFCPYGWTCGVPRGNRLTSMVGRMLTYRLFYSQNPHDQSLHQLRECGHHVCEGKSHWRNSCSTCRRFGSRGQHLLGCVLSNNRQRVKHIGTQLNVVCW